jgi:hypothetical protein
MDKKALAERLRTLAVDDTRRPKMARLRDVLEDVEMALAAGAKRADVVEALRTHGLDMSLSTFKTSLKRRRARRACPPSTATAAARITALPAQGASPTPLTNTIAGEPSDGPDALDRIIQSKPRPVSTCPVRQQEHKMKVAVVNFSGNVGKTAVAANLLKPRLQNAPMYSIESLNSDAAANNIEVEKIRGRKYRDLQEKLMVLSSAIVDVDASNVEEFLKLMQQYAGSHEEFDYFVVPVGKEKKQMADTVSIIRALSRIGVPCHKIRSLFNMVDIDDAVEREFAPLFGLARLEKSFTLNLQALIYANEVFDKLKEAGKSLDEITADPVDYRARFREACDDAEKDHCVRMVAIKRLAVTGTKNLNDAFKAVFS